ncbi:MAG: VWA domain-containing protein [Gammaproteobacteria bacterium]|nr:MAG: VWA domain-containing protein [Gammaproteobacteria bacterium]
MGELTFQWPWVLAGLICLPWLPDWLPWSRSERTIGQIMHPELLRLFSLSGDKSRHTVWMRWIIRFMGLCTLLALAGPTVPAPDRNLQVAPRPLIIVLDLSLSMYARDISPSRIERARQKLQDVLKKIPDRPAGLIAYAGDAFSVVPVTRDHASIELMLPDLSPAIMPLPGSRPDRAIRLAGQWAARTGGADLLIITDDLPAARMPTLTRLLDEWPGQPTLLAMGTAAGAPIPIPERGFLEQNGTVIMAALPVARLEQLASETRLRWHRVTVTEEDIDALLTRPDTGLHTMTAEGPLPPHNIGYWFVLPVVILSLVLMPRFAVTGWVVLMMSMAPSPADALEFEALWQNRDQRAWHALQQGEYEKASRLADDPMLRGSALYRAGQYSEAARVFAQAPTAEGHYNRGNALAQAGQFDEARSAYLRALALDPGLEAARKNLALLDQLQRQSSAQAGTDQEESPQTAQDHSGQSDDSGAASRDASSQTSRPDARATSGDGEGKSPASADTSPHANDARTGNTPSRADTKPHQADSDTHEKDSGNTQAAAQSATGLPTDPTEVWLRRIPDTPGALLQRKFQLHAQERGSRLEEGEPIW